MDNRLRRSFAIAAVILCAVACQVSAAPPASDSYLIRNVRIFDGHDVMPAGEVLVVGNKIQAVSPAHVSLPEGVQATVIDGKGRLGTGSCCCSYAPACGMAGLAFPSTGRSRWKRWSDLPKANP